MGTDANGVTYRYIQDNGSLGTGSPALNDDLWPDYPLMHQKLKLVYDSGVYWEQYDNYMVSDEGEISTIDDFSGISSTADPRFKERLLQWNFEQVITSSVFEGRKIDLVVEPKTLIQSGLIR